MNMKHGQRVRITGGTYHTAGNQPTGTIVGLAHLLVAGEWVMVRMVQLDRTVLADNNFMEITHLPVGEENLTPIE